MITLVCLLIVGFLSNSSCGELRNLSDVYVSDLVLSPCNANNVISLSNVYVEIDAAKELHVSGTLNTTEELLSPISASVVLKKKVWMAWIEMPCEHHMGSCDYEDLCSYGYPITKQCPTPFSVNRVPCRCPFPQGAYTLPVTKLNYSDRSVITGKYKGTMTIKHLSKTLACYNFNFNLKTK